MSSLLNPDDIGRVASKVIADAIQQTASVLVPALAAAGKDAVSGIAITVGPITIDPIKITLEVNAKG